MKIEIESIGNTERAFVVKRDGKLITTFTCAPWWSVSEVLRLAHDAVVTVEHDLAEYEKDKQT
jgi:hypothetical protein